VTAPRLRLVSRGWWPQPGGIERQFSLLAGPAAGPKAGPAGGPAAAVWTGAAGRPEPGLHRSPTGTRPAGGYGLWLAGSLALDGLAGPRPAATAVGGSSLEAAVVLALPSRVRGRAVVYLAGGGEAGSELACMRRGWLRRLILRRADAVIVHTASYADELRAAGCRGEVHAVALLAGPPGEPCRAWASPSRSPGRVAALWCGRDHPVKDLPALARLTRGAFAEAGIDLSLVVDRRPGVDFGPAPVHVGCPNPRSHAGGFDVLVLTSRHESQPNVVAEAALEGVPAVAYDVGGLRESLAALGHGAVVPPGAPDAAFAAAVAAVARQGAHPAVRADLAGRARDMFGDPARAAWRRALLGTP